MRQWQRPQQRRVHQREDRAVGADAERQRERGDRVNAGDFHIWRNAYFTSSPSSAGHWLMRMCRWTRATFQGLAVPYGGREACTRTMRLDIFHLFRSLRRLRYGASRTRE